MASASCPLCGSPYKSLRARKPWEKVRHHLADHMTRRHPDLGTRDRSLLLDRALEGGAA